MWTILQRDNEFVFPCKTGEILQERHLLSTAVYKAGGDLRRGYQQHSPEEEEEARDPDPDVEALRDVLFMIGDYMYRNHVAPRTKLFCSEGRFSDTSGLH